MPDVGLMEGVMPEVTDRHIQSGTSAASTQRPSIWIKRFFKKYKPDPLDPKKGIEEDWVEWGKPGLANWSTVQAIKQLMPRPEKKKPASVEWVVIGPAYEAWKKNEDAPVTGTPLYAWPGIPREAVDIFKKHNVTTVEHLAEFPDDLLPKLMLPRAREWRDRAKAFVAAMTDDATGLGNKMQAMEEANKKLAEENAEKDSQLRDMMERLSRLEAAASEEKAVKRGPGRPRKVTNDGNAEPGADAS